MYAHTVCRSCGYFHCFASTCHPVTPLVSSHSQSPKSTTKLQFALPLKASSGLFVAKMRQLITLGRMVRRCNTPLQLTQTSKRLSHGYVGYREVNYDGGRVHQKHLAEFLAGVMYWWIGWNLMTDWRHLIGEFIWPQRSEWTDEELGIPQD